MHSHLICSAYAMPMYRSVHLFCTPSLVGMLNATVWCWDHISKHHRSIYCGERCVWLRAKANNCTCIWYAYKRAIFSSYVRSLFSLFLIFFLGFGCLLRDARMRFVNEKQTQIKYSQQHSTHQQHLIAPFENVKTATGALWSKRKNGYNEEKKLTWNAW